MVQETYFSLPLHWPFTGFPQNYISISSRHISAGIYASISSRRVSKQAQAGKGHRSSASTTSIIIHIPSPKTSLSAPTTRLSGQGIPRIHYWVHAISVHLHWWLQRTLEHHSCFHNRSYGSGLWDPLPRPCIGLGCWTYTHITPRKVSWTLFYVAGRLFNKLFVNKLHIHAGHGTAQGIKLFAKIYLY